MQRTLKRQLADTERYLDRSDADEDKWFWRGYVTALEWVRRELVGE